MRIIQAVYRYRALTTPHIEALFFAPPGQNAAASSTRCRHRLQMLYHNSLLDRIEQLTYTYEGRKPLVYMLTEQSAQLIADRLDVDRDEIDWHPRHNKVSHLFLTHLLQTNDVRIALDRAAQRNAWTIERWLDDRTLKSRHAKDYVEIAGPRGGKRKVVIVPDGYFALDIGKPQVGHFFLELDRRTETVASPTWNRRDWVRKIHTYLGYYRSGGFEKRYKARNLRILTVTTGERRAANMKQATESAGGNKMFWFTTFEQATDPERVLTDSIWQIAGTPGVHCLTKE